jgi:molybdate transport system substrate-binding protein
MMPQRQITMEYSWTENLFLCSTLLAALVLSLFTAKTAKAQEIRVAAAADLKFAMQDLAAQFEKKTGTKVDVTYGSSGNFFSQLKDGAPFDLFFSADIDYARKLETAGIGEPGTLYTYAVGRIVIWMPPDPKTDLMHEGWQALLNANVQKIAIANPEHAPYGRAAVAALQNAGIYDRVKEKLVYGENISQAAQFVQSGNAQAGIVAMSLAVSPAMKDGQTWEIPANLHAPIEQAAIVLKNAKNKKNAHAFLQFTMSTDARETFVKFGFTLPAVSADRQKN